MLLRRIQPPGRPSIQIRRPRHHQVEHTHALAAHDRTCNGDLPAAGLVLLDGPDCDRHELRRIADRGWSVGRRGHRDGGPPAGGAVEQGLQGLSHNRNPAQQGQRPPDRGVPSGGAAGERAALVQQLPHDREREVRPPPRQPTRRWRPPTGNRCGRSRWPERGYLLGPGRRTGNPVPPPTCMSEPSRHCADEPSTCRRGPPSPCDHRRASLMFLRAAAH